MQSDSLTLDGRLLFGNFTQIFYRYDINLDQLPVTLPNGMILLRSEYNGVDSLNVYYKWSKLPDSKPVFNSYTTFDSLVASYDRVLKVDTIAYEIYQHQKQIEQPKWEHNATAWSYCGLSLSFAIWLGCLCIKIFR